MSDPALFELNPRDPHRHVLMPCMGLACGRGVLEGGSFIVGPSQRWDEVTCPDCLAIGLEALRIECRRQQDTQR